MSHRKIDVIHVLARRDVGGVRQFLLYPHGRWSCTQSGTPFLAVPTKKVLLRRGQVNAHAVRTTCAAVLNDDLGGQMTLPPRLKRWAPVTLDTVSPARQQPTTYTVWPVVVSVPAPRDNPQCNGLRGEWLSASESLNCSRLSPTPPHARRATKTCRNFSYEWSAL
jgi:hypothetical protein